ncbi:MAG: hypothetical protein KCHDKBKB_01818 [Elusimicrobia bacterium]|nr:hypothetical protein [Elusimicrobiota bacterium]
MALNIIWRPAWLLKAKRQLNFIGGNLRGLWHIKQLITKVFDAIDPTILNYKPEGGLVDLDKVYSPEDSSKRDKEIYLSFAK